MELLVFVAVIALFGLPFAVIGALVTALDARRRAGVLETRILALERAQAGQERLDRDPYRAARTNRSPARDEAEMPVHPSAAAEPPVADAALAALSVEPARTTPAVVAPPVTLEQQIGLTWLTRIGVCAFVIGAAFFFKYAIDQHWLVPEWAQFGDRTRCGRRDHRVRPASALCGHMPPSSTRWSVSGWECGS